MRSWLLTLLILLVASPSFAIDTRDKGATHDAAGVTVSASNAGVEVASSINNYCTLTVKPGALVRIWFVRVDINLDCATAVTAYSGVARDAAETYEFTPRDDGWVGKICAIRESGSGSDTKVLKNCW